MHLLEPKRRGKMCSQCSLRAGGGQAGRLLFVYLPVVIFCFSAAASPLEYYDSFSLATQLLFPVNNAATDNYYTSLARREEEMKMLETFFSLFSLAVIRKREGSHAAFWMQVPHLPRAPRSGLEIFLYILPSLCSGRN